ncbi:MAG: hypothetical protein KF708_11745 [Pirellulales bacterium]|nr:hypothetical protein [Pirellulales bacterium]
MPPAPWGNSRARRVTSFAGVVALAALVWLVVLPTLGNVPSVRAYIEYNERAGIDPSAKFYSELPAMRQFIDRATAAQRRLPK